MNVLSTSVLDALEVCICGCLPYMGSGNAQHFWHAWPDPSERQQRERWVVSHHFTISKGGDVENTIYHGLYRVQNIYINGSCEHNRFDSNIGILQLSQI
jgi:hypothetical protein